MMKRILTAVVGVFVLAGLITSGVPQRVSAATYKMFSTTSKKVKVSTTTLRNKNKLEKSMVKRRQRVQKQSSIINYLQYLAGGSLKTKKEYASTQQPMVLFSHEATKASAGEKGSVTPVKITEEEFLTDAPHGPMYGMVNWWCSAAAVYISYTPDAATEKKFGIYSGDCTNPNAFITGNFNPQRLGIFDPVVPLTFTIRNVDPEDQTIIRKVTTDPGECDIDYYKSLGHRDVYAAQYSCDDGYVIGTRDDIQFTVYVFPPNWPDAGNTEAVLKRQLSDEDKDGLIRRLELAIGTNPDVADTDKDGIKDGDEYLAYQTSPLAADTDGDGVKDGVEVARKTNPLGPGNATADQLLRWSRLKDSTDPVISSISVTFGSNSATVSWTTDLAADGIVNWGSNEKYGAHKSDFSYTKNHAIAFTVSAGTTYHYAIRSCSTGPNAKCTTTPDFTFDVPEAVSALPQLSGVTATVENGYATVSWQADLDTDGIVNWGTTSKYGTYKGDFVYAKTHAVTFAVTAGTTYHYNVRACTPSSLCTTSSDRTFFVPAAPTPPDETIPGETPSPPSTPTSPTISDVAATVSNGYATVSWTTDLNTDGIVNWGTTSSYEIFRKDFTFKKTHEISFSVNAGTTYHYAIRSCTPGAVCVVSDDLALTAPDASPVAPTLSDVKIVLTGRFGAVSWTADVDSDGIINYGTTTAYGKHVSDFAFTKTHGFQVYFPTAGTYHYAIRACTRGGLCTTTPDATIEVP